MAHLGMAKKSTSGTQQVIAGIAGIAGWLFSQSYGNFIGFDVSIQATNKPPASRQPETFVVLAGLG